MSTRAASLADVETILALGMRVKPRTVYATMPVDKERARTNVRRCISSPQSFARVAEVDGKIVGVLLGVREELWFSSAREAKDLAFYAEHSLSACALVKEFKAWAWSDPRTVNAVLAQSSGVDVEKVDRWLPKMGFARVGGVFLLGRYDEASEKLGEVAV